VRALPISLLLLCLAAVPVSRSVTDSSVLVWTSYHGAGIPPSRHTTGAGTGRTMIVGVAMGSARVLPQNCHRSLRHYGAQTLTFLSGANDAG